MVKTDLENTFSGWFSEIILGPCNGHYTLLEFPLIAQTLSSAILNGQVILDLSKAHVLRFFYNFVKRKYGNDVQILFMDTDSVAVQLTHKTMTAHEMMYANSKYFDLSEHAESSGFRRMTNCKRAGTFKVRLCLDENVSLNLVFEVYRLSDLHNLSVGALNHFH